jgi:hypothetical protein
VGIEGNDQLGGRDTRPDAEIQLVVPNHPAQKEIESLASAPGRGTRKEIADARSSRYPPVGCSQIQRERPGRKTIQRSFDVLGRGIVALDEKPFHRS